MAAQETVALFVRVQIPLATLNEPTTYVVRLRWTRKLYGRINSAACLKIIEENFEVIRQGANIKKRQNCPPCFDLKFDEGIT